MVEAPSPERLHHLVEPRADARHLRLRYPRLRAQRGHQIIHRSGGHPGHVGLHDDRVQRPVDAPPRLEHRRQQRALASLGILNRLRNGPGAVLSPRGGEALSGGGVPGAGLRPGAGADRGVRRHRGQLGRGAHRRAARRGHHCGLLSRPAAVLPRPRHHQSPDGHLHPPRPNPPQHHHRQRRHHRHRHRRHGRERRRDRRGGSRRKRRRRERRRHGRRRHGRHSPTATGAGWGRVVELEPQRHRLRSVRPGHHRLQRQGGQPCRLHHRHRHCR